MIINYRPPLIPGQSKFVSCNSNNLTIGQRLNMPNDESTLTVDGTATFNGDVVFNDVVNLDGTTTFDGNVDITSNITFDNEVEINGNLVTNGDVDFTATDTYTGSNVYDGATLTKIPQLIIFKVVNLYHLVIVLIMLRMEVHVQFQVMEQQ